MDRIGNHTRNGNDRMVGLDGAVDIGSRQRAVAGRARNGTLKGRQQRPR